MSVCLLSCCRGVYGLALNQMVMGEPLHAFICFYASRRWGNRGTRLWIAAWSLSAAWSTIWHSQARRDSFFPVDHPQYRNEMCKKYQLCFVAAILAVNSKKLNSNRKYEPCLFRITLSRVKDIKLKEDRGHEVSYQWTKISKKKSAQMTHFNLPFKLGVINLKKL